MLKFTHKIKNIDDSFFEHTVAELDQYAKDLSQVNNARVMGSDLFILSISRLVKALGITNKSANKESQSMFLLTLLLGFVAILQLFIAYGQFKLGEVQIDFAHEQTSLQKANWEYEKWRNDRIETRDTNWRREDLEAQGRLPIHGK